jgi:hypothetical protein
MNNALEFHKLQITKIWEGKQKNDGTWHRMDATKWLDLNALFETPFIPLSQGGILQSYRHY